MTTNYKTENYICAKFYSQDSLGLNTEVGRVMLEVLPGRGLSVVFGTEAEIFLSVGTKADF